jgi:hypothetical protein
MTSIEAGISLASEAHISIIVFSYTSSLWPLSIVEVRASGTSSSFSLIRREILGTLEVMMWISLTVFTYGVTTKVWHIAQT